MMRPEGISDDGFIHATAAPIKMQESRVSHVGLAFVSVDRLAKQPVENKK
jgi:hypothetical protein